jgi:hypothetical protein
MQLLVKCLSSGYVCSGFGASISVTIVVSAVMSAASFLAVVIRVTLGAITDRLWVVFPGRSDTSKSMTLGEALMPSNSSSESEPVSIGEMKFYD